ESKSSNRVGSTFDPLFPVSTLASLLDTLLIWGLCSGVIALCVSSNNYDLMQIARRRRNLYLILGGLGLAGSIISFIAPKAALSMVSSGGIVLVIPYVFAVLFSVLLILLLMRRAANTFSSSAPTAPQDFPPPHPGLADSPSA